MSTNQILKIIYAGVAVFGTYLSAARFLAGDWVSALWPLAIVLFCVYRLATIGDDA
jgi:hypothetical protein